MVLTAPGLLALASPSPGGPTQPTFLFQLVPFVLIFVVFYFLLIAPARKKQKKHAEMIENLKAGERVITQGGIYGTVVGVTDSVVQLRVANQVTIEVAKHAIAGLQQQGS